MKLNYHAIKYIAKKTGVHTSALLAMSAGNDPFYMGSPADMRNGKWFAQLFQRANRPQIHLRALHYIAVSLEVGLPCAIKQGTRRTSRYENTQEAWQFLIKSASAARWLGMVPFDRIIDNKNDGPVSRFGAVSGQNKNPAISFDFPHLLDPDNFVPNVHTALAADVMPYYMALFSEKSSVGYVVNPIAKRYYVDTQMFSGEFSHTALHQFVQEAIAADRPSVLFVLSDFDAAGRSIALSAARRVEWLAAQAGFRHTIVVKQIGLTKKQVLDYDLPFTPMKSTERRADSFMESMGVEGAVELDAMLALYPDEFSRLIEKAIFEFVDFDKLEEISDVQRRVADDFGQQAKAIMAANQSVLSAAQEVLNQVHALSPAGNNTYIVDPSKRNVNCRDDKDVILISAPDPYENYTTQLLRYKSWGEQSWDDDNWEEGEMV